MESKTRRPTVTQSAYICMLDGWTRA